MTAATTNHEGLKTELMQRLQRLQTFLQQDPENERLRTDLFDTALAAGEFALAEEQVQQELQKQQESADWRFRLANLRIAQKRFGDARQVLLELEMRAGAHPAITHNLAHIEFAQQNYAACQDLLSAWVEARGDQAGAGATVPAEMQVLWLRTLHRLRLLEKAWDWVQYEKSKGTLSESAAGVASLIAIDANHFQDALQLSELALSKDSEQMEALVARASVALAQRDANLARRLAERALQHNATDGRAWSASGFAEMLAMNIPLARQHLEQAVHWMPAHIGTWHGLGWACVLLQDMAGARRAFDAAMELDRNFGETHGGLAVVLALTGDAAQAEEHINIALRLDKSNLSARYAQAILSGEAKDARGIQRLAERLLGGRAAPMGGSMQDWLSP